jgi:hypothetical protein
MGQSPVKLKRIISWISPILRCQKVRVQAQRVVEEGNTVTRKPTLSWTAEGNESEAAVLA